MRTRIIVTAALFVAVGFPAHAVPTLSNGDFAVCSGADAGSWTESNIDGAGGCNSGGFILNDGGSTVTNPTITQAVGGLEVGGVYRVTGDYRRFHSSAGPDDEFGVEIDNDIATFDLPDAVVRTFTLDFTFNGLGLNNVLRLTGERNSDNAPLVDNISIVELRAPPGPGTNVPEPSALMVLAPLAPFLLGAGWLRRQKIS